MMNPRLNHRRGIALMAAAAVLLLASCRSPMADAQLVEQMRQLADELNASRQDAAAVQAQIDSLRTAIAKQDTIVRQLANLAGVAVPPR
jgi:hypothetical protein